MTIDIKIIQTSGLTRKAESAFFQQESGQRSFSASFSSEFPVDRYYGKEVLVHDKEHIDLSRVKPGGKLPLIAFHDQRQWPIGYIENFRLDEEKKVTRGTIVFAETDRAEEPLALLRQDVPLELSIGYDIDTETARYDKATDTYYFRWTPHEVSILPIGADKTIGIGRAQSEASNDASSKYDFAPQAIAQAVAEAIQQSALERAQSQPAQREVIHVSDIPTVAQTDQHQSASPPVADITAIRRDLDIARNDASQRAVMAERARVSEVGAVFDLPSVPKTAEFAALRARALQDGWSADQARKLVLEAMATDGPAVDHRSISDDAIGIHHQAQANSRQSAVVVDDQLDKFRRGVGEALIVRAGIDNGSKAVQVAREGGYLGVRLSRLAEQYLQIAGIDTRGLNDEQVAMRAMQTRASGMTTSDFSNILYNTANKAMLMGWEQAPETWRNWTRIGSVSDFKANERVGLSGFSSLEKVLEDGEIKYGKVTDRRETVQAYCFAKKFRLTYQAIKNDDLSAFTAIPRAMGRAAQSIIGDTVYALLDGTGPTLNQDSTALFDTSTHKNYVAAATAPTVDTLNTANSAMKKQTDPNHGKVLNITPRYLIVPVALEMTANILMAAQYNPDNSPGSTSGKSTMQPNPFQNRFQVVSDARLDGQTNGTAAWYLAADPNVFDTIEVVFIDGVAEPYLKEQEEWDTRGVEWVTGVDFGVGALDYRGIHKYKGNT